MSESVWADSSGCPERTQRPQNSHCHSRRNVLSHARECGGMVGWFAAFFFFSFLFCFRLFFATRGAQRAPFRSHPPSVLWLLRRTSQKIWKEGGNQNIQRSSPQQMLLTFFLCVLQEGQPTLLCGILCCRCQSTENKELQGRKLVKKTEDELLVQQLRTTPNS